MKFLFNFFLCLPFCLLQTNLAATCDSTQTTIIVSILTDDYGDETGWEILDNNGNIYHEAGFGTYNNNQLYTTEVCVPKGVCISFAIFDDFKDGLESNGYFQVSIDGVLIVDNPYFLSSYAAQFNCPQGSICNNALPIDTGIYIATLDTFWYKFTPEVSGLYSISTCNNNSCDTRIWVYNVCPATLYENNQGTILFDDNDGSCAPQAQLNGALQADRTYYIRIGDSNNDCMDNPIYWNLTFEESISGCTDTSSCNFNPLATIDDGSCIEQGSPECPEGPDLVLTQSVFETSIYLSSITTTDPCLVQEGCLTGYGKRDIVRFSTRIENNGELDYLIGEPIANSDQFTYDNCHDHYHYDGYAEYLLFDEGGNKIPVGFKNGFCVLDWVCPTNNEKYSCEYMGITAGCYDEYWAELECQWIDITDVADGRYTFVTRVNWDNAPDALGHKEKNMDNNWAQVCLFIDRSSGSLKISLDDNCTPYVDCNGEILGNAQIDCNGECGGTAIRGDLDGNGLQQMADAQLYVTQMLGNDILPIPCNDLNADNKITVYDAALLSNCLNFGMNHNHPGGGAHDHCNFPGGRLNNTQLVRLSILDFDPVAGYLDIGMLNNYNDVVAYQFTMSGIKVQQVENLVDPNVYPIQPFYSIDGMVTGISFVDSLIKKTATPQPICRIYYSEITADEICIDKVIEIVNGNYERTLTAMIDNCVMITSTGDPILSLSVNVQPNPFSGQTLLRFNNGNALPFELRLTDMNGRELRRIQNIRDSQVIILQKDLVSGVYFYQLKSDRYLATGKLVVQ